MAAITWTDVTDVAKELTTVSVGAQTAILLLVNDFLDVGTWGGEDSQKLKMGRVFLAAHIATLSAKRKGKAGTVSSEAAGGLSRSYQSLATATALSLTSYGDLYTMLAKSTAARAGLSLAGGAATPSDPGWGG